MGRISPVKSMLAFAPQVDDWPVPDQLGWSAQKSEQFEHRVAAIKAHIEGLKTGVQIQRETQVNRCMFAGLLKKCLEAGPDGQIMGFRALVPHKHHKRYTRRKPVAGKPQQNRGCYAGALQYVLRLEPRLEAGMHAFVLQRVKLCRGNPEAFRKLNLYEEFVRLLYLYEVPTEWPANTKDGGKKTLYKWFDQIIATTPGVLAATQSDVARTRSQTGFGTSSLLQFVEPFYAAEIDSHMIDTATTVVYDDGVDEIDVNLTRWWILAMVECHSTAVLSHLPVYSSEVSALDVQKLIKLACGTPKTSHTPPEPYQRFAPGAGFPNVIIPALSGAVPSLILFDNALAHLAKTIHIDTRKIFGFAIGYGRPGTPSTRHNVEHLFDRYEDNVGHQLPSSTGNRPENRPRDSEKNAVKLRIRAEEVARLTENYFANYNVLRKETIPGLAPLEILRRAFDGSAPRFIARHLPPFQRQLADILTVHAVRTVKGNAKGKRPYIQYESCQYTSPKLATSYALLGKQFDCLERGGRHLDVYFKGEFFDQLTVMGKWSGFEHSIRDRRAILSSVRVKDLSLIGKTNFMQAYHEMLIKRLKDSNHKQSKHVALELRRIESETDFGESYESKPKAATKFIPPIIPSIKPGSLNSNRARSWKIRNR